MLEYCISVCFLSVITSILSHHWKFSSITLRERRKLENYILVLLQKQLWHCGFPKWSWGLSLCVSCCYNRMPRINNLGWTRINQLIVLVTRIPSYGIASKSLVDISSGTGRQENKEKRIKGENERRKREEREGWRTQK